MRETSVEKVNQINRNSVTTINVKMAVNETPSKNPNNPPTTEAPKTIEGLTVFLGEIKKKNEKI